MLMLMLMLMQCKSIYARLTPRVLQGAQHDPEAGIQHTEVKSHGYGHYRRGQAAKTRKGKAQRHLGDDAIGGMSCKYG